MTEYKPDKIVYIHCNTCQGKTNHRVASNYVIPFIVGEGKDSFEIGYNEHEILECMGCNTISYRHFGVSYDDYDEDGNIPINELNIYPDRLSECYITKIQKGSLKLAEVEAIFFESIKAFNLKLYLLAAIGIRATVEAICKSKKINKGQLFEKIEKLSEKNFLTNAQTKILHGLRFIGNQAAHEVKAPTKEDLLIALDILEHLINSMFVLVSKAEMMKGYGLAEKERKKFERKIARKKEKTLLKMKQNLKTEHGTDYINTGAKSVEPEKES